MDMDVGDVEAVNLCLCVLYVSMISVVVNGPSGLCTTKRSYDAR